MTHDQALQAAGTLAAFYPEVDDERLRAYATVIVSYTVRDFEAALPTIIAGHDGEFLPPIRIVIHALKESRMSSLPSSLDAWDEATGMASSVSVYGTPGEWSSPLVAHTIERLGGWVAFCSSEEPRHWLQRSFRQTYDELRERAIDTGRLPEAMEMRGLFRLPAPSEAKQITDSAERKELTS